VGLVVSFTLPDRLKEERYFRALGVAAPLLVLAVQLGRVALGAEAIPAIIEFAALLQVLRLLTRRGAAHDHQVILLALLHLVAGTVLGGGLTYALTLVGFLVLTPGALVLSHLRREVEGNYRQGARDRSGMPVDVPRILRSRRVIGQGFLALTCLLSLPIFLLTALLFVTFPRVGLSWLIVPPVEPTRVVGFSERVELGGIGTLRSDPALVLRVRPDDLGPEPPLRRNLYLRGALFDTYERGVWSRTPERSETLASLEGQLVLRRLPRPGDRTLELELEPIEPRVVFVPGEAVSLSVLEKPGRSGPRRPELYRGGFGELRYEAMDQSGLSYRAHLPPRGRVTPERTPDEALARYLVLPAELSPRIVQLAERLSLGQEEPGAIALALETALREGYSYDLASPSGAAADPLEHFLFESKRGHCEYYATAMALMLRARGVPSRNVTGFVGGTYNRFGEFYAVRQGDAHAWVEAYLPRFGWTRFDPTPPASAAPQAETEGLFAMLRELMEAAAQTWNTNVEGFDLERQVTLLRSAYEAYRKVTAPAEELGGGRAGLGGQRLLLLLVGLALIGGAGYWLLRRGRSPAASAEQSARAARRSIELYRRLEGLLASSGVPRPPGTPPRTHAEALRGAGHPLGTEAAALTEVYLRVRFGGEPLTEAMDRDYQARLAALRRVRPAAAAAPGPAGR
jgi:transglutaminase-like putative cysteine protease